MSLLKDILTETKQGRTKYSQGRVYLFISFTFFFMLNVVLGIGAISNAVFEDHKTLLVVSENLRWALGTFALYVLGGKGIGAFRDSKTGIGNDYMHEAPYGGYNGGHGGYPPYGGHPGGYGYPGGPTSQEPIDPTSGDSETDTSYYDGGEDYYTQGDEEVV